MSVKDSKKRNLREGIGTLNEKSLHAEIIDHLAKSGDILEADIEGYRIDIQRGDRIIEVQTRNLRSLAAKVLKLAENFQIDIVYPIYKIKYIHRVDKSGETISRRKSPKTGKLLHLFEELLYAPHLFSDRNVSLTILMIEADEIWRDDGLGSWRRKHWSIDDRKLIRVVSEHTFPQPVDLLDLLPQVTPSPFTNRDISELLKISPRLAGKITYTLQKLDLVQVVGKQGRAKLFNIF